MTHIYHSPSSSFDIRSGHPQRGAVVPHSVAWCGVWLQGCRAVSSSSLPKEKTPPIFRSRTLPPSFDRSTSNLQPPHIFNPRPSDFLFHLIPLSSFFPPTPHITIAGSKYPPIFPSPITDRLFFPLGLVVFPLAHLSFAPVPPPLPAVNSRRNAAPLTRSPQTTFLLSLYFCDPSSHTAVCKFVWEGKKSTQRWSWHVRAGRLMARVCRLKILRFAW